MAANSQSEDRREPAMESARGSGKSRKKKKIKGKRRSLIGRAAYWSLVLGLWMLRCLRPVMAAAERRIGLTVSGLLAGIVFVDWLAVAEASRNLSLIFLGLFGLAWIFQRFVPAT